MHEHDPLNPHSHDPNPEPPTLDPEILLSHHDSEELLTVNYLINLPQVTLTNCYIVSTGHGISGPFAFRGPTLSALIMDKVDGKIGGIESIEVVSADGFGTRVYPSELFSAESSVSDVIVLAIVMDGKSMTREQGLVRLIVPSETEDALRQVKWVGEIRIVSDLDRT